MKVRNGFVSNSSSSSFVLDLDKISGAQLEMLLNHGELGEELSIDYSKSDAWSMSVEGGRLYGSTHMDNFDMKEFMEAIDVDPELAEWDED